MFTTYLLRFETWKRSAFGNENNCLEGELLMGLIDAWRLLLDIIEGVYFYFNYL